MNKATAIREFRKSLKNIDDITAYQKFKPFLDFPQLKGIKNDSLKFEILMHYIKLKDKGVMGFVSGLTDENFDFERYKKYKEFRKTNKFESSSEEYFQLKYGHSWESHYKNSKKNRFNMYDPQMYVKERNMTLEEADKVVIELKEKTKPTLEKYLKKYGNFLGEKKFKEHCRRHKNYVEYWNKIYPLDPDMAYKKFKEYTTSSSLKHVNFYLKRGYTEEEARKKVSDHQLNNAGVHRKYYENLGMKSEDIDKILQEIHLKKDSCSLEYIKKKYPKKSELELLEKYLEHNLSKSSSYRSNGYLLKDDPFLEKRISYYEAVDYYTRISEKLMSPCPGKRGSKKGQYHIDHVYSKHYGYENAVPPFVIGSIVNLQWLLAEVNCSKKQECAISKEQLLEDYKNYESQKNRQTQS
jgi:uncharacterized protein YehS (DUF1456 family)